MTRTAVLICPGRGSYNKEDLGYLGRHHSSSNFVLGLDAIRSADGNETVSVLDGSGDFKLAKFSKGDVASPLIYACSFADAYSLAEDIEVVAVTGNSMGWYTTLGVAGAVSAEDGFRIVDTMGALMQEHMIGGQIVYPVWGSDWVPDSLRRAELLELIREIDSRSNHALGLSIDLAGALVVAGNDQGLSAFEAAVPQIANRFPMRLSNHAAFHTQLQNPVSEIAQNAFANMKFGQPRVPMVDGRGHIWWPSCSDPSLLRSYTFGQQIVEPYEFGTAIRVAAQEFAPDMFIILGPGTTMGGAVAQSLIGCGWMEMKSKSDFEAIQDKSELLVSMARADQRSIVEA